MTRRISGFTPSGVLHLGNYLGAIRPIVEHAEHTDTVVFISDLHALTLDHDPALVRARTLEFATLLLAAGVDPDTHLFLAQSHVPEHAELHYLLECTTGHGEAQRMIQFREKARRQQQIRMSLLTYPILMAADILLYDAEEVPVGDDQSQHVELARDVAYRFNTRYGKTFVVPRAVHPPVGARIMDLPDPAAKMSKSASSAAGALRLVDDPDAVRRKVSRAVTDTGRQVRYDPDRQPGVANLLAVLAGCTGADPAELATGFDSYGQLKQAVTDAVVDTLAPLRKRHAELSADPAHVQAVLRTGADRARQLAGRKIRAAKEAIGLLPG